MTAGSGIVVGIDPSLTSTGVVQLRHGKPVALNCFGRALHVRAGYAKRAERMTFTLSQTLRAVPRDAELVVMEGMAYGAGGNHLDPDVFGLWWHIFTHLHARPVPIAVIPPTTLKVWATGKAAEKVDGKMRRTDKADMIDAAQLHYPDVTIRNGDVADALHAATCGTSRLGYNLPSVLNRRRNRYNVDAVAWPDGIDCPDCGHPPGYLHGGPACVQPVERKGRREYCGCTTLADAVAQGYSEGRVLA